MIRRKRETFARVFTSLITKLLCDWRSHEIVAGGSMTCSTDRNLFLRWIVVVLVLIVGVHPALGEVIELEFKNPAEGDAGEDPALGSLVKVRGPGGVRLNGLYLMTHYGDHEEHFISENQAMIVRPLIEQPWRYCSVFSYGNKEHMIVGRNWDNENVGSIIVNLYLPEKGYSSISFSRSIDMNIPHNIDLVDFRNHPVAKKLLVAPFYAFDGINEHGLVVSVAGVKQESVHPRSEKELIYVPFLVRKILDRAKDVEEAVKLAENFIPFDLDHHSLNTHFFVADESGRSVILEYVDDEWKKFSNQKPWQVLENRPIHDMTDEELRARGWRHRKMSEALEKAETVLDWQGGLAILEDVAQKGTSWSVVYSPTEKDLYFTVYQDWDTVYHLEMPRNAEVE
jgi:hypothetical protein